MRNIGIILGICGLLLCAAPASADAPAMIPVQGHLAAADGTVVNDVFAVTFTIYSDSGGTTSLWSEEVSVNFVNGYFTAYLGTTVTLDLTTFRDNDALFLGIQVAGDDEMTPFELGTSPFAAFAQFSGTALDISDSAKLGLVSDVATQLNNDGSVHARYTDAEAVAAIQAENLGVPAGAVMSFASSTCPAGWLNANGASVDSATYPDLAAALGATGSFSLPDLRGEFVRGLDDGRGVDGGRPIMTAQGQDFKSFNVQNAQGPVGPPGYTHGPVTIEKSGLSSGPLFGGYWAQPAGLIRFQWDGSEVRPRNVALLYCIKT